VQHIGLVRIADAHTAAIHVPLQPPGLTYVTPACGHCASCRLAELYARWFYEDSARTRSRLRVRMGNLPGRRRRAV
jgi:hypothetical protein